MPINLDCTNCKWRYPEICRQCRAEAIERQVKVAEIKEFGMDAILRMPEYRLLPNQIGEN